MSKGVFGVVKVSANIAAYLGAASTFTMSGRTQGVASYADGGLNETITQATAAVFAAEVDYDYSLAPTPEPATFALIGGALVVLGLRRKRII